LKVNTVGSNQIGQIIFGVLLVLILVALAGFFSWRQWRVLSGLRQVQDVSPEDRRYMRRQAWRRIACSLLMVVLAGLLAGHFRLEDRAHNLIAEGETNLQRGEKRELNAEEQQFLKTYYSYWLVTMLVLLGLITLAGFDFFAIRRYGRRHYRQIQADRRAMIENQLARLRIQRNGHG
jgi:hypothetical protein